MRFSIRTVMTLLALLLFAATNYGQVQPTETGDPIEQLRLTPEQRQRIRLIAEQTKNERQVANRRVREANVALDQALDADPVDENLVEQRVNEFAAAQAAQIRLRVQMEVRIRRELRPEQLATLRRLRLQLRDVMGVQRPLNQTPGRQGLRPNPRNRAFPRQNIPQP